MRWLEPLEGPRDSVAGARAQEEFGEAGPQLTRLNLGPQPANESVASVANEVNANRRATRMVAFLTR